MKKNDIISLFIGGLTIALLTLIFQNVPGYMDAEYYYSGGIRIYEGQGLSEPFIWNYLSNPDTIPHPSHTYWMPLTSIIAALGLAIAGSKEYIYAQLIFVILFALIPILTAFISYKLSGGRKQALFAGALAIFPLYYFQYLSITDSFVPYMVVGSLLFLMILSIKVIPNKPMNIFQLILVGILCGLMHLTRADGLLWLVSTIVFLSWQFWEKTHRLISIKSNHIFKWSFSIFCIFLGYLLIMTFWYLRNLQIFGTIFPPNGFRMVWMTNYDQLFTYPAENVNFQAWLSSGIANLLMARWDSFLGNLKTALAVQMEIFMLPLVLIGFYRLKKFGVVFFGVALWVVTFFIMTIIFPFAGVRGGFLHSGAALQPLLWALAAEGLYGAIIHLAKVRKWEVEAAYNFLSTGLIILVCALSIFIYRTKVIGNDFQNPAWEMSWNEYKKYAEYISEREKSGQYLLMIKNPARYYLVSRQPSIVIPEGRLETLLEVSDKFNVGYLVLEKDHVSGLDFLYENPSYSSQYELLGRLGDTLILKFVPE